VILIRFTLAACARSLTASSTSCRWLLASIATRVRLFTACHFISDLIDGSANEFLHLLFLFRFTLRIQINLRHPEFNIDWLVAKWTSLVESTDGCLATFNFLIEHVGNLKPWIFSGLQFDAYDGPVRLEKLLDFSLSNLRWDHLDKQVRRKIFIYVLIDGCLALVVRKIVLAPSNVELNKKIAAVILLLFI